MKNNFENGIFDINFNSERNFDGSIELQFFTKSINLEKNLKEIERIKNRLEKIKFYIQLNKL